MGRRERSEKPRREYLEVVTQRRCNGVIGYELTGSRRTVVLHCGSRKRKLVEGNRFITREKERGTRNQTRRTTRRKRRCTNNNFVDAASSFCFFFCAYIHIHTRALCTCPSSFVPSGPASSSLRHVLFRCAQNTWTRREVEAHIAVPFFVYLWYTAANHTEPYRCIFLFFSLVFILHLFKIASSAQESRVRFSANSVFAICNRYK